MRSRNLSGIFTSKLVLKNELMKLLFVLFLFCGLSAHSQEYASSTVPDDIIPSEIAKYSFGTNSKENFNLLIGKIKINPNIKLYKLCEDQNTMIITYKTGTFKSEDALSEFLKAEIDNCIIYKKQESSILKMCEDKFLKEK